MSVMLQHVLQFYKYGGKQLYYFNSYDGQGELNVNKLVGEEISDDKAELIEDECDSCKI